jgi:glutathione reductase (NADPH)
VGAEVDKLSGIYRRNLENAGVEVIDERAELKDAHTILLKKSGRTVTAETILIATGARPHWPKDLPGCDLAFSSNDVFHLEALPKHVLIAGGGYIACEFAGVFAGLGADVCLVYRGDTVLRGFDMDVRTDVHEGLQRAGVRVITHAEIEAIEERPGGRRATRLSTGVTVESDAVLLAVGRQPNTDGMGLDAAGVETVGRGAVKVDEFSRTTASNIYAVGDVTDRLQLTPVAIREAEAFVKTAFGGRPTAYDHRFVASAVFTTPEVGVVGYAEGDARKTFGDVEIYKTRFRPMSHVIAGDPERMLMKLVVRKSDDVVVGCHIVGPGAGELIQLAGVAVKAGLTKQDWDDTCAVHPTVAEELVTLREPWRDPSLPPG